MIQALSSGPFELRLLADSGQYAQLKRPERVTHQW
jgi:hypothetical protein